MLKRAHLFERKGWFMLLLATSAVSARADFLDIRMFNSANYTQTAGGETFQGYNFEIDAITQSALGFNSAQATYPGPGSPVSLTQSPSDPAFFSTAYGPYSSLSALHSNLPLGNYTVSFTNGTVTDSATISYTSDHFQTAIPQLSATSFAALQNADPARALTLDFNPFTPDPAANDTIGTFVSIYAPDGSTAFTTFVAPNVTSVTIPAGTLFAGTDYSLALQQGGRLDTAPNTQGVETELGFSLNDNVDFTTAAPEPAFLGLFGLGLIGFALLARRVPASLTKLMVCRLSRCWRYCFLPVVALSIAGLANASSFNFVSTPSIPNASGQVAANSNSQFQQQTATSQSVSLYARTPYATAFAANEPYFPSNDPNGGAPLIDPYVDVNLYPTLLPDQEETRLGATANLTYYVEVTLTFSGGAPETSVDVSGRFLGNPGAFGGAYIQVTNPNGFVMFYDDNSADPRGINTPNGSFSGRMEFQVNTLYTVTVEASAETCITVNPNETCGILPSGVPGSIEAGLDPVIQLDPSVPDPSDYTLEFSPNLSLSSVPEPSTWALIFSSTLAFVALTLGKLKFRGLLRLV